MLKLNNLTGPDQHLLLVLIVVLMVAAGCIQGPTPTPTPPGPPLSATEVLEQARQAMIAVVSYKFVADRTMHIDGQVYPSQISFQSVNPDQFHMRTEGIPGDSDYWGELISVGDRTMHRGSGYTEGAWTEGEPLPSSGFWVPGWPVTDLKQAELHDDADIDGRSVYRITASRPVVDIDASNSYDLYIDKEHMLVWRLIMESTYTDPHEGTTIWNTTFDFYDYNVPVTIELPEISE